MSHLNIYKVDVAGYESKYFLHKDAAEKYLEKLASVHKQGGHKSYSLEVLPVHEQSAEKVTPLFSDFTVLTVWDAQVVVYKGAKTSVQVNKTVELVQDEVLRPLEYAIDWLANCSKGFCKSIISQDDAILRATEAAKDWEKAKESNAIYLSNEEN